MKILAIDPGYQQSAWVRFDGAGVIAHAIEPNEDLLSSMQPPQGPGSFLDVDAVIFEQIESFGMAVGREVFETVFWTGRFFEAAMSDKPERCRVERMPRRTVKLHLCQSARAQDSNIRTALLDRFGGLMAIGKKHAPGPLYGIKSHEWSALAIAATYYDQRVNTF